MVDGEVILEASAVLFGTGISALFYYFHSRHDKAAKQVEGTQIIPIDDKLISKIQKFEGQVIPYTAISGRVVADRDVLRSRYFPEKEGVILNFVTEERKEVWAKYMHVWQETDREVSSITDTVPFSVQDATEVKVQLVDPLESSWTMKTLDVVNKEFRSPNSSIMDSILGIVSGDRVKGYTDTEKMLRVGTQILGIGELFVEDDKVKLRSPASGKGEYIITRSTHAGVVARMRLKSRLWKFLFLMLFGATAAASYFMIKRWMKKYKDSLEEARRQEELREVRNQRSSARSSGNASDRASSGEDNTCVICLTNPRECVILECGHICACVDCIEALPSPKLCPVCRGCVEKIVPLFYA